MNSRRPTATALMRNARSIMNEESIFVEALEKGSREERSAYLDEACCANPQLRVRVEQLLDEHDHPDSLFDNPPLAQFACDVEQDELPERLGDFEIIREIGRGGMGTVYEARQISLNRRVALKILSCGLTTKAVMRFKREAEAAARLHHTNIVPIYFTGEEKRIHYYVMELVDGPSLDQVLRGLRSERPSDITIDAAGDVDKALADLSGLAETESTGISRQNQVETTSWQAASTVDKTGSSSFGSGATYFDNVARMMAEVADALAHAHDQGVIHRDIKPSNLLLSKEGQLSVNDFGLARILELPGVTVTGEFAGSPLYMSPEQIAAGHEPIDHRTDIYSLGATLYEMLTLCPPFPGKGRDQVLSQVLQHEPTAPRRIDRGIPIDLQTICRKAMEKEPKRRYQTAEKMAEDLRRVVSRHSISARRISPIEHAVRWCRRNPAVSSLTGALLLAILCAVVITAWQRRQSAKIEEFLNTTVARISYRLRVDDKVDALRRIRAVPHEFQQRPELTKLFDWVGFTTSIHSKPEGATVFIRESDEPDNDWIELGESPLVARVPWNDMHFKITKEGYDDLILLRTNIWRYQSTGFNFHLPKSKGMVRVEGKVGSKLPFVGHFHSLAIDPFLIDRHEVTNGQYQQFADAGGYESDEYWKGTLGADWNLVVDTFRDSTGAYGPKLWKQGRHLADEADHPVRGVSWYEAAAYAQFVGKRLPTIHHWYTAARKRPGEGHAFVGQSNMNNRHEGPLAVETLHGIGPHGTYDMAGNVREWCLNDTGEEQRYVLGGSWRDSSEYFGIPNAIAPDERPDDVGFRCAEYDCGDGLLVPAPIIRRDFYREYAARQDSDVAFASLREQFVYEHRPWHESRSERGQTEEEYKYYRVQFSAGYGPADEMITGYLLLPDEEEFSPPFQVVILTEFKHAYLGGSFSAAEMGSHPSKEALLRAGRALFCPIYWGTFERASEDFRCLRPDENPGYKRAIINISKDFSRSVDFLEDHDRLHGEDLIDEDKIAYHGYSWGAAISPILLAADELVTGERRIKAAVLHCGGLMQAEAPSEVDQLTYVPHAHVPVLMLNGREEAYFPLALSQEPLYRLLPLTAQGNNHHICVPGMGNWVGDKLFDREANNWLDRHLGRPTRAPQ